jgi:hypothetical protein
MESPRGASMSFVAIRIKHPARLQVMRKLRIDDVLTPSKEGVQSTTKTGWVDMWVGKK